MKKLKFRRLTSFLLALTLLASMAAFLPLSASAEPTPDLIITTPEELEAFLTANDTYSTKTIVLANDIDMKGGTLTTQDYQFRGVLDGQGHTISNFTVSQKALFTSIWKGTVKNLTIDNYTFTGVNCLGTIATFVKEGGTFENVHVRNSTVTSSNKIVGGIVGSVGSDSGNNNADWSCVATFTNCSVENTTLTCTGGNGFGVGGLIGRVVTYNTTSSVTLTDCYVNAAVTGKGATGGLIGQLNGDATLTRCAMIGSVTDNNNTTSGASLGAGGMIGWGKSLNTVTMTDCFVNASITGKGGYGGGMIGYAQGTTALTRCVSLATVTATNKSGLITARTVQADTWDKATPVKATLTDCYSVEDAVWRHINRYFACVDFEITNTDGTVLATLPSEYNGYNAGANPTDQAQICKDFSAPVNKIATPLDFASLKLLKNWVQTGENEILPAELSLILGKSPISASSIAYQKSLTDNADGTVNVRFVVAINDLRFEEVGLNVQITRDGGNGPETSAVIPFPTKSVYTSVIANGETVSADSLGGKYVFAIVIENVNYADYENTFTVSAFAKMENGTLFTTPSASTVLAKKAA